MNIENNRESFFGSSDDGRFITKCCIGVGLLIGGLLAPKGFDVLGLPMVGKLMEVGADIGAVAVIGSVVVSLAKK